MEGQLILDRYRPLREIGAGGFATVVLAWDTRMQRRVALKRLALPLDSTGTPETPPGLAEARTAAMLSHPAIVTTLDFDTDSDEAFIIMEYVDGASLAEVLDEAEGRLTLDEAAAVVEAVAGALEFAHDNGVLHLDVKPENVLIDRDGRVKVTDFGIAELSSLTGHGSAYGGTPGYMPLEQLDGRDVSERTDEWALAALTFEMLTGDNPFGDTSSEKSLFKLEVFQTPSLLDYGVEDFPLELDEVLQVALGSRPSDRFPSVTEFADEILPLLGDPADGRTSLAELVELRVSEEAGLPEYAESPLGLWDRLGGHAGSVLLRIAAMVEAAWLAWAGLAPFALDPTALGAAVGLVALAAVLAPSLGIGLGTGCLVAGVAAEGHSEAAIALAVGAGAWWWFLARERAGAAVLPLAAPALAGVRAGFAQPLIAGFVLPPASAAASAALGGGLMMFASAATLNGVPYSTVGTLIATDPWNTGVATSSMMGLLSIPETYIALLGWPLAAAIMSLMSERATRSAAVLGTLGGVSALAGSYLLAERVGHALGRPAEAHAWAGTPLAWGLGASLILMLAVIALGAPLRPEPDGPHPATAEEDEDRPQ